MCVSSVRQPPLPLLARAVSSWSADTHGHPPHHGDAVGAPLTFSQGDIISVLQLRDDWWLGQLNGTQGWFPKCCVAVETGGNGEYVDAELSRRV